jgi:metallo-beta-lactamase class B
MVGASSAVLCDFAVGARASNEMMVSMKTTLIALGVLMSAAVLAGQNADAPEAHIARAKAAAGNDYQNLFNFLCAVPGPSGRTGPTVPSGRTGPTVPSERTSPTVPSERTGPTVRGGGPQRGGRAPGPPERSTWYAEPAKVFDNLYFVGQSEYSAWAVITSEGIILIDTLFDYSVEEEVAGGLKKLGLDPATIRYAVVTHPHPDHHGGAQFLQDRYKTRIVMSAADWDVIDRLNGTKPARDSGVSGVATDGQTLTLGDTTVTLYITPGHTPGTLSVLIPVRENGARHVAALWGGTGLNADRDSLEKYIASAQRFDGIAQQSGADIILSNHTDWDGSKINLPRVATRAPGGPNPYIVGTPAVRRYLEVARECATARVMRLK